MMNLQESISPTGGAPRLTADAQCLLSITDSLKSSGQILGLLNLAISNPRTTIPEIATILRRDVMLSARIIRIANSAFFVRTANGCKTIEDALQRVGMREIARLVATATMQGMAPRTLRAYGITGEQYNQGVLFTAAASQLIATEVKLDSNVAYLAGLMRPLGILVLNKWAEQQLSQVDTLAWGGAGSLLQWERNTFGLNHIEVSSFITRKWGFPAAVSESIEKSCDQLASINDSPMSLILQTAETLAESNRATFHAHQSGATLRKDRLDALGIKSAQLIQISRGALQQSRDFSSSSPS
jgi:HD-like signal output (HDOD) protein